jgi:hypothetical protein
MLLYVVHCTLYSIGTSIQPYARFLCAMHLHCHNILCTTTTNSLYMYNYLFTKTHPYIYTEITHSQEHFLFKVYAITYKKKILLFMA